MGHLITYIYKVKTLSPAGAFKDGGILCLNATT